ncbi:MAG: radical SAM protein [Deltaproteobacteria bacterium]|nr:radical SAM protein [Deltaproteobacteria bacterium]
MSGIVNIKRGLPSVLLRTARWHMRHYLGGVDFPLAATFQLTNRCNLRCVMCNIPNNPDQGVLSLDLFRGIVRELSTLGCCFASLSGGEVLTIPDFFDYLREAKKSLPSVNTVTNGLLLDEAAAMEFNAAGVDSVSLSLDGMDKTHESIRRSPGAFSKTVRAIENLKKHAPGVKVVVNTVIMPGNIDDLYRLTRFVNSLKVAHKFQPLNEHPSFDGQKKEYSVDREMDLRKVRAFVAFLAGRKNVANSKYFLRSIPGYFSNGNRSGLFNERCHLPKFFCEFRENGMMYPCLGGVEWKDGYPAGKGLRKIFESAEYGKDVKKLEGCRLCQRSYSVCYIEPRVTFPVTNFFKYKLFSRLKGTV